MLRVDLEGGDIHELGKLDDLAITGDQIKMVRFERMSDCTFWGALYMNDGSEYILGFNAKKGKLGATIYLNPARSQPGEGES